MGDTTINRAQFVSAFTSDDGSIDVDHLSDNVERALSAAGISVDALRLADRNGDGVISGEAEAGRLFSLFDRAEGDRTRGSFVTRRELKAGPETTTLGRAYEALQDEIETRRAGVQLPPSPRLTNDPHGRELCGGRRCYTDSVSDASVDDIKAEAMDARIADARKAFRAQSKLDKTLLDNIDGAIDKVAGDNPELRLAFYRHYSSSDLQSWTGGKPGDLGDTSNGDSKIKQDLLALQGKGHNWKTDDIESLLASTLVHELTHTPQGGRSLNPIDMVIPEGKAYGVESFFAERMGDRARERFIDDRYGGNDPLDNKAGGKLAFEKSYATMRELYRVIDGGQTNLAALAGVTPERARELAAEFITRNEDGYSRELKALYKEVYRP